MKIAIIVGSHRENSQSNKVAAFLMKRIAELKLFDSSYLLDLASTDLPFWDEGVWKQEEKWQLAWSPIASELTSADAFIIVSPEYGGMVPARLKNLFLLSNSSIMGNKPALIVAISSGLGGSYPINELRISSYKNTKICYIPDHLIIRKVEGTLNEEPNLDSEHDVHIRPRVDYTLKLLSEYAKAFIPLRASVKKFEDFNYGM